MKLRVKKYFKIIVYPELIWKQKIKNLFQVDKITKIGLNTTSTLIKRDIKFLIPGLVGLEFITGQKMKALVAKKSIAGFQIMRTQPISCKVTLRGKVMFSFLEKMIDLFLPGDRNFWASNFSENKGIINFGSRSFFIFLELEKYSKQFRSIGGLNFTVVTSLKMAQTPNLLFSGYGFPLFNK